MSNYIIWQRFVLIIWLHFSKIRIALFNLNFDSTVTQWLNDCWSRQTRFGCYFIVYFWKYWQLWSSIWTSIICQSFTCIEKISNVHHMIKKSPSHWLLLRLKIRKIDRALILISIFAFFVLIDQNPISNMQPRCNFNLQCIIWFWP